VKAANQRYACLSSDLEWFGGGFGLWFWLHQLKGSHQLCDAAVSQRVAFLSYLHGQSEGLA
jgi:hypothetical protein